MKRAKRTVYILPDLSARIDETAALGGQSPNAIIEAALADYFARESVFGAVETQTRRLGEIDERVRAQNATLAKMGESLNALGKTVMDVKAVVERSAAPAAPVAEPAGPEPTRKSGILGWR
ncbi:putative transcriptional regulator [Skermanella aerolata]|uniref:ribbon-helix-helix protein, CopG family n=1 Tax=Skermanella aerolata TaxID=393310 RepID=UPI003D239EB5